MSLESLLVVVEALVKIDATKIPLTSLDPLHHDFSLVQAKSNYPDAIKVHCTRRSLAPLAVEILDVTGAAPAGYKAIVDVFGDAVAFTTIYGLMVRNRGTAPIGIRNRSIMGLTDVASIYVNGGGFYCNSFGTDGMPLVVNDGLNLENLDAVLTADFDVFMWGK